jgi:hypothetical protein
VLTAPAEITTDARSAKARLGVVARADAATLRSIRNRVPPRAYVADDVPGSDRPGSVRVGIVRVAAAAVCIICDEHVW